MKEANFYNAIESGLSHLPIITFAYSHLGVALFVSFIINLFVVCVFAATFYGKTDPNDIMLRNAGPFSFSHF